MTTVPVTVGCDPEAFLKHQGQFVSAHGLIPGTKAMPHSVTNGAVQVDGMAVEFNITPASSSEQFVLHINTVMEQLRGMLKGYDVVASPVAYFDEAYMRAQPEEALELGCEADYDAYREGEPNPRPNGDNPFRTAGGHVHIGWATDLPVDDPEHIEACIMLCRELDYYLGVPSLFWDEDDMRREMYGNPGAFRAKSYGVEYRSLSNAWIKDERLMTFVFNQVQRAFHRLVEGHSFYNTYGNLAADIIRRSDRDLARTLMSHNTDLLGDNAHLIGE